MAKIFITERDVEDMARRGELSISLSDDVVLTELAYEKAQRLGVVLLQPQQLPPSAPIRPYLSQPVAAPANAPTAIVPGAAHYDSGCQVCGQESKTSDESLRQKIRDSVKAKLGNQIDPVLLETIITRVLNNVGVK